MSAQQGLLALKEFKVMLDLQGHKAYRVFREFKEILDLQGQQGRPQLLPAQQGLQEI
jgi:hypothetical protein